MIGWACCPQSGSWLDELTAAELESTGRPVRAELYCTLTPPDVATCTQYA